MRIDNWESKLSDYMESNRDNAFKYGTWDCCIFAAGAVEAITGVNHLKKFKYKTKKTAEKLLTENGGIEAALNERFESISIPVMAGRGDIILFEKAVGICVGSKAVFLNEDSGYKFIDMRYWEKAWGVI